MTTGHNPDEQRSEPGDITIAGDGNVIGSGNTVNVNKSSSTKSGATVADFVSLLAQLREALPSANLDSKTRSVIESDIEAIKTEAKDGHPSLPVIESKLKSTQSIVAGVVGLGSTLAPYVVNLGQLAQQLFK